MIGRIFFSGTAAVIFAVLQSVFFSKIMPAGIVPDIALIILIASAWRYGSLVGEIAGFIIGISLDALGLAPLGFHTFIYTTIGYLFGRMQDSVSPGTIFLPVLGSIIATLIKYTGAFLLSLVFGLNSGAIRYFSIKTIGELGFNMLLAPVIFILFSSLSRIFEGKRGGFN